MLSRYDEKRLMEVLREAAARIDRERTENVVHIAGIPIKMRATLDDDDTICFMPYRPSESPFVKCKACGSTYHPARGWSVTVADVDGQETAFIGCSDHCARKLADPDSMLEKREAKVYICGKPVGEQLYLDYRALVVTGFIGTSYVAKCLELEKGNIEELIRKARPEIYRRTDARIYASKAMIGRLNAYILKRDAQWA